MPWFPAERRQTLTLRPEHSDDSSNRSTRTAGDDEGLHLVECHARPYSLRDARTVSNEPRDDPVGRVAEVPATNPTLRQRDPAIAAHCSPGALLRSITA